MNFGSSRRLVLSFIVFFGFLFISQLQNHNHNCEPTSTVKSVSLTRYSDDKSDTESEQLLNFMFEPHVSSRYNFSILLKHVVKSSNDDLRVVEIGVASGDFAVNNFRSFGHILKEYVMVEPEKLFLGRSNPALMNVLSQWKSTVNIKLIENISVEAVKMFPDNYFDFIYIDGDHSYKSVSEDMGLWYPKLRVGGLFAGHDFCTSWSDRSKRINLAAPWCGTYGGRKGKKERQNQVGSFTAVKEFAHKNNVQIHYTLEGRTGDLLDRHNPSWFFLKV